MDQVIDTWAIPFSSLHHDKASLLFLFASHCFLALSFVRNFNTYLTPLKKVPFLHLVIWGSKIRGSEVDEWNSNDRAEMGTSTWKY